jgi:hypothetical protein
MCWSHYGRKLADAIPWGGHNGACICFGNKDGHLQHQVIVPVGDMLPEGVPSRALLEIIIQKAFSSSVCLLGEIEIRWKVMGIIY